MSNLCTCSRSNAEYSSIFWQVDKHRIEKEVQTVPNGRHSGPLLVVAGGLLIEERLYFVWLHGRLAVAYGRWNQLSGSIERTDHDVVSIRIAEREFARTRTWVEMRFLF
jgi:hypothetical protein